MSAVAHRHLEQARATLRIPALRRVASLLEGDYAALHLGRSTEFNDLREYIRGDDPKDLDWKASARARTLLVRRYEALRRLHVLLVVSSGRSMSAAASPGLAKRDLAVAVAGLVGHLAVRHGDAVGLARGDREAAAVVPGRGGAAHVERCLQDVWSRTTPDAAPSDLASLLRQVNRSVRTRCFVVVVSDLDEADADVLGGLRRLRAQHEVLMVLIDSLGATDLDPGDHSPVWDVDLQGPVPGWVRGDRRLAAQLETTRTADRVALRAALDQMRIAHVDVADDAGVLPAVRTLFERHRRVGRG